MKTWKLIAIIASCLIVLALVAGGTWWLMNSSSNVVPSDREDDELVDDDEPTDRQRQRQRHRQDADDLTGQERPVQDTNQDIEEIEEGGVFTVVYAISDDGFLNIRSMPSNSGEILGELPELSHGLGRGVLRERGESWSKISMDDITGWVYNRYLGTQDWFENVGTVRLIAARNSTTIYTDDYSGENEVSYFTTVKKGTIIADTFDEIDDYYVLTTAHDCLYVKKSDVQVR